ncbi:hypothetical protein PoB_003011500 [Plakobranchus ocellatus]|uniref:Uncharacterized protein n=1 Tax=Plakobranchus ocellatus TaxID=259542 RepID=A0AAV4A625_9GAST|nr:hypothetical protein PoB_003011500 [Plakobranchus ocellatus]
MVLPRFDGKSFEDGEDYKVIFIHSTMLGSLIPYNVFPCDSCLSAATPSSLPPLDYFHLAVSEPGSAHTFFESCFKLLKEIQVWPPTKEIVSQEVVVVCNTIVVYLSLKVSAGYYRESSMRQMTDVISQSLGRGLFSIRCLQNIFVKHATNEEGGYGGTMVSKCI